MNREILSSKVLWTYLSNTLVFPTLNIPIMMTLNLKSDAWSSLSFLLLAIPRKASTSAEDDVIYVKRRDMAREHVTKDGDLKRLGAKEILINAWILCKEAVGRF